MFNIEINATPIEMFDELAHPANIIINDFHEWIHIPVSYWNIEQYRDSWKKSIQYGLESKKHAVLVTSMYEPDKLNFVFTWILYFDDEVVHVQNRVIFVDEHVNFNINDVNLYIDPRKTHDEDGMEISEWDCELSDIVQFYHSL